MSISGSFLSESEGTAVSVPCSAAGGPGLSPCPSTGPFCSAFFCSSFGGSTLGLGFEIIGLQILVSSYNNRRENWFLVTNFTLYTKIQVHPLLSYPQDVSKDGVMKFSIKNTNTD